MVVTDNGLNSVNVRKHADKVNKHEHVNVWKPDAIVLDHPHKREYARSRNAQVRFSFVYFYSLHENRVLSIADNFRFCGV